VTIETFITIKSMKCYERMDHGHDVQLISRCEEEFSGIFFS
jgi:hypothetical protein